MLGIVDRLLCLSGHRLGQVGSLCLRGCCNRIFWVWVKALRSHSFEIDSAFAVSCVSTRLRLFDVERDWLVWGWRDWFSHRGIDAHLVRMVVFLLLYLIEQAEGIIHDV